MDPILQKTDLCRHQIAKSSHRLEAIKQAVIEIEVQNLGSIFDLRTGHSKGLVEVVRHDHLLEQRRSSNIASAKTLLSFRTEI